MSGTTKANLQKQVLAKLQTNAALREAVAEGKLDLDATFNSTTKLAIDTASSSITRIVVFGLVPF